MKIHDEVLVEACRMCEEGSGIFRRNTFMWILLHIWIGDPILVFHFRFFFGVALVSKIAFPLFEIVLNFFVWVVEIYQLLKKAMEQISLLQ